MISTQPPSFTQFALASGTPLYRDPYRKVSRGSSGHRSALLEDPVETVGDFGKSLLAWLEELVKRAHGNLTLVPSGPVSERALSSAPSAAPEDSPAVRARVAVLGDASVRAQATEVLDLLRAHLPGDAVAQAPDLALSTLDDGSVIIEWPLPGRRLGFALNPSRAESGWFFVSGPTWGNIMASGALDETPMEQLTEWVLSPPTNR